MAELIIKYNGDILAVARELNGQVEILDFMFAILTLPVENIPGISKYPEIEFTEYSK